ncbi:Ig-like domain-containing protein [Brevibacillus sp. SYSU BS000544]|uniref:Ig-like domain-containing protein n=1 Tax=Brevibacillus sp. SYSU BS000544 TaxID=3416443 RepID=UPI003CE4E6FD
MYYRLKKLNSMLLIVILLFISVGNQRVIAAGEISNLILTKNSVSLEVGDTQALTATAIYVNGSTEDATIKTVWTSGSEAVASVYAGTITAKSEGTAVITATYLGKTVVVNVTVHKKVRALNKDKQSLNIRTGAQDQIQLTAYYTDGTSENVTNKAEWTIDNYSIATVMNGLVVGQSSGTTTVSAKYGSQTITVPVTVEMVRRLDIDKSQISLFVQGTETVKLTATLPDGTTEDVTSKAVWTTDKEGVADAIKGVIKAYGTGQAIITASYGGKTATIKVEVEIARKLEVDKPSVFMRVNTSEQLQLKATYADGTSEVITDKAEWTSSKESVAFVNKGKVSAYSPGEAEIKATYGNTTITIPVDVEVARKLELNVQSLSMRTGTSEQVKVTATYANGQTEDVTDKAEWKSNDETVAFVSKGKITAYSTGEAIITAKYGEKTVTTTVDVDIPTKIEADKTKVSLQIGESEKLKLLAYFGERKEDITEKAEWTSGSIEIAEIKNGVITAVGTGSTTITAKFGRRTVVVPVTVGVVQSLVLDEKKLVLKNGATKKLKLTATYTDGLTKDVSELASWQTQQEGVASVSLGTVTANGTGKTNITATFEGKSVSIPVEVGLAQSITANFRNVVLGVSESKQILLTAVDSENASKDVTNEAEWISSNNAIVAVSKGNITGYANGRVTVTAKYGGQAVSIPVEVGIIQRLEASTRFLSIKTGQKVQVTVNAVLTDGTTRDVTSAAEWKPVGYKIADVQKGLVTGVGNGKTTIYASYGGKNLAIPVEVDVLKYLKTDVVKIEMKKGETRKVTATATYIDGSEANVTVAGIWSSSRILIADAKDGIIRANEYGTATITVNFAGKKATVLVVVR